MHKIRPPQLTFNTPLGLHSLAWPYLLLLSCWLMFGSMAGRQNLDGLLITLTAPLGYQKPRLPLSSASRSGRRTQKLITGEGSCAIFLQSGVFCVLFVQKWNGYGFSCGIMFMGLKRVLWEANTKINHRQNHRRTELCNISMFECILLPVHSEVEWVWIFLWNHVHGP
jgi:hypothetical protein